MNFTLDPDVEMDTRTIGVAFSAYACARRMWQEERDSPGSTGASLFVRQTFLAATMERLDELADAFPIIRTP